jgi:hypothetical protein
LTTSNAKQPRKGQFVKGQSGNPAGRSKLDKEVTELARQEAPAAFQRIIEISKDDDDKLLKLKANQYIVDRACGRPKQQAEVEANLTGLIIRWADDDANA